MPEPCAYSGAAIVGKKVYVAVGTTGLSLKTVQKNFWHLDLSNIHDEGLTWEQVLPWPGPSRVFTIVTAQHNGTDDCVYVMSGRRTGKEGKIEFLTDVYEFTPARYNPEKYDSEAGTYTEGTNPWRQLADVPRCVMGGTGIPVGQSHIFILGGAGENQNNRCQHKYS